MASTLKRLASASGYYTLGTAASGAISFGLLAVFTRFLTPADFGVLAILTATLGVLRAIVGLNPHLYFTAKYPVLEQEDLSRFGGAALWLTGAMTVASYVVLELLGVWFETFRLPHWVLAGLAVLAGAFAVLSFGLTTLKMRERPKPYAAIEVLRSVAAGGIGVVLVVVLAMDWRGKFLADVIAGLLAAGAMGAYLIRSRQLDLTTSRRHFREYADFSLPVVPHALGYWAINAQDRYFVFAMSGAEAAGLYSIGYMLAQVLEVANQGVLKAFSPFFYGHLQEGTKKDEIVLMTYGYLALMAVGALAFVFVLEAVIPVFLGSDFTASAEFIPWIVAGYAFNAARNFMTGYLYVAERTDVLAIISIAAAVLNAGLNYWLILWLGAIGAAVATAATFGAVALATSIVATRLVPMPWRGALADWWGAFRD